MHMAKNASLIFIIFLPLALVDCENFIIRVSTGKHRILCSQAADTQTFGQVPSDCSESAKDFNSLEACVWYPSDGWKLFHNQWLCVNTAGPSLIQSKLSISFEDLNFPTPSQISVSELSKYVSVTKMNHSLFEKFSDNFIFGIPSDSKGEVQIWELILSSSGQPVSQQKWPALVPVAFNVNSAAEKMDLLLGAITPRATSKQPANSSGSHEQIEFNQNLFKIGYYFKKFTSNEQFEELVLNIQPIKGNNGIEEIKCISAVVPLAARSPKNDFKKTKVRLNITVEQGRLFDSIDVNTSKSFPFSVIEYDSGEVIPLTVNKQQNFFSYEVKHDAENSAAILLAADQPNEIWNLAYFEIIGVHDLDKRILVDVVLRLDHANPFTENDPAIFKSVAPIREKFGVSVYRIVELDTPLDGHPDPSDPHSGLKIHNFWNDGEFSLAYSAHNEYVSTAKAIKKNASPNAQCDINSIIKAEKVEFESEPKYLQCANSSSKNDSRHLPCDLKTLEDRIRSSPPTDVIKVKNALFAVSKAVEGDHLCTDGKNVYYVHFEHYWASGTFELKINKFEDHFQALKSLI